MPDQVIPHWEAPAAAVMEVLRRLYRGKFYTRWVVEVVQNAADAGAKNIQIRTGRFFCEQAQTWINEVSVEDDGQGMDEDVISNVLFRVGGSKKDNPAATGGFGIAKLLIFWSTAINRQIGDPRPRLYDGIGWELFTNDLYYNSALLGNEPVRRLPEDQRRTGTMIRVYRSEYPDETNMREALENCGIKARIFFNGEEVTQLKRARERGKTDWCRVLHKHNVMDHQRGRVVVRINGVFQFTTWVNQSGGELPGAVIVEIKGGHRPTDDNYPLTPNRESLRYEHGYHEALMEFVNVLRRQPEALREEDPWIIERYSYDGQTTAGWADPEGDIISDPLAGTDVVMTPVESDNHPSQANAQSDDTDAQHGVDSATGDAAPDQAVDELESAGDPEARPAEPDAELDEEHEPEMEEDQAVLQDQIARSAARKREETARRLEAEREKAIKDFVTLHERVADMMPDWFNERIESWTEMGEHSVSPIGSNILSKRDKGVRVTVKLWHPLNIRLLMAWKLVLAKVMDVVPILPKKHFHVGWTISEKTLAELFAYSKNGVNETYMLLNPTGVRTPKRRTLTTTLVMRALHELLHLIYPDHDENFIYAFHNALERNINPRFDEFTKIVKAAMSAKTKAYGVKPANLRTAGRVGRPKSAHLRSVS